MTQEAPRARALVMCPVDLIPPSARIGTPYFFGEFGDVEDGAGLGAAHRADLLRGADGADAHADPEAVGAGVDEV